MIGAGCHGVYFGPHAGGYQDLWTPPSFLRRTSCWVILPLRSPVYNSVSK